MGTPATRWSRRCRASPTPSTRRAEAKTEARVKVAAAVLGQVDTAKAAEVDEEQGLVGRAAGEAATALRMP